MRRRITFLQRPNSAFDPESQATLKSSSSSSSSLQLRNLHAAREERITLHLEVDEDLLPSELSERLRQCGELKSLNLRWATRRPYLASGPFSSRVAPGLHAFVVTVKKGRGERIWEDQGDMRKTDQVCDIVNLFYKDLDEENEDGKLKCTTVEESFTVPPDNDEGISSYQFYSQLPSLDGAILRFLRRLLCDNAQNASLDDAACRDRLQSIDSLDIDYDLHTLTVSAYWSTAPTGGWTEDLRSNKGNKVNKETVEVGLLEMQKSTTGPGDIKLGGFLAVVGSDDTLKPTLFSIPSRHHQAVVSQSHDDLTPSTYAISFAPPTGLHPTMTISIPRKTLRPPSLPDATCSLHTYLTLPSGIFADKYQLSTTDPLFLHSHNLVALRAVSGETDLEAPDWFINRWGSTWLLEVATPFSSLPPTSTRQSIVGEDANLNDDDEEAQKDWTITIPLHLRYLLPSESGNRTVDVPWPVVFWACQTDHETSVGKNPFDRRHLGWDGLFKPNTLFYHLTPAHPTRLLSDDASRLLVEELKVPVLKLSRSRDEEGLFGPSGIEFGTVLVVGLGFLWVLWKLGLVLRKAGFRPTTGSGDARYGNTTGYEKKKN